MLELLTVALRADGCFSVLKWQGKPFAVGVEHTFEDELPIIRKGLWRCVKSRYHKGGYDTYEILVPGHSRVLFHRGNTEEDSLGCIIVGESFGELKNKTAVLDSKGGFAEFMALMNGREDFLLNVVARP